MNRSTPGITLTHAGTDDVLNYSEPGIEGGNFSIYASETLLYFTETLFLNPWGVKSCNTSMKKETPSIFWTEEGLRLSCHRRWFTTQSSPNYNTVSER